MIKNKLIKNVFKSRPHTSEAQVKSSAKSEFSEQISTNYNSSLPLANRYHSLPRMRRPKSFSGERSNNTSGRSVKRKGQEWSSNILTRNINDGKTKKNAVNNDGYEEVSRIDNCTYHCGSIDNNKGLEKSSSVAHDPSPSNLGLGVKYFSSSDSNIENCYLSDKNINCSENPNRYRCSIGSSNYSHPYNIVVCIYCHNITCTCSDSNLVFINNNYLVNNGQTKSESSSYFLPVLQGVLRSEKTNRNDFIILGLGIHHYIKELFGALDHSKQGYVHYRDLEILCCILGRKVKYSKTDNKIKHCTCQYEDYSDSNQESNSQDSCVVHLNLQKFSEIICHTFADWNETTTLERRNNTQLVNTVVNITRRKQKLDDIAKQLDELEKEYMTHVKTLNLIDTQKSFDTFHGSRSMTKDTQETYCHSKQYAENIKLKRITLLQQQELQCLREVIEDLRISLQSSDAENLALRVKEYKIERTSESNSSVNLSHKLAWSDDEKDSIDKMIQDFPSNEQLEEGSIDSLFNSNSKFNDQLKTQSSTSETQERPPSLQSIENCSSKKLDTDFEAQMKETFQKLTETNKELEETRYDLETSVLEIQAKDKEINALNQNLKTSKIDLENLRQETADLGKEKQEINLIISRLNEEVKNLKLNITKKEEEIYTLKNNFEVIKNKNNRDIKELWLVRNIIAKTLLKVKRHEDLLKAVLSDANDKKDITCAEVLKNKQIPKLTDKQHPGEQHHSKPNSVNTKLHSPSQANIMIPTISKRHSMQPFTTTKEESGNRCSLPFLKLQHIENSEVTVSENFKNFDSENTYNKDIERPNHSSWSPRRSDFTLNSMTLPTRRGANCLQPQSKPMDNITSEEKLRSSSSLSEIKPMLEVKPNLIKPIISAKSSTDQHLSQLIQVKENHSDAEANIEETALSCASSPRSTSSTETNSLKMMHSDPKQVKFSNRDLRPQELITSGVVLNNHRFKNSREFQRISLLSNMETPKNDRLQRKNIISQSSTQILEGLEAEVENLRRALEDEQLCG